MNKRAFTLLELLVVIVILGILLAILFPAMGRVREGARRALCLNNLRQHGIAWYLYLDDHGEKFPSSNSLPQRFGVYYIGGAYYIWNDFPDQSPLNSYLDIYDEDSNLEIFRCPGDRKPFLPGSGKGLFDYCGLSYRTNGAIIYLDDGTQKRHLSSITSSHSKIFLEMCHYLIRPGHGDDNWWSSKLPKIPVMVLFLDGHTAGPFLYDSEFGVGKKVLQSPN